MGSWTGHNSFAPAEDFLELMSPWGQMTIKKISKPHGVLEGDKYQAGGTGVVGGGAACKGCQESFASFAFLFLQRPEMGVGCFCGYVGARRANRKCKGPGAGICSPQTQQGGPEVELARRGTEGEGRSYGGASCCFVWNTKRIRTFTPDEVGATS